MPSLYDHSHALRIAGLDSFNSGMFPNCTDWAYWRALCIGEQLPGCACLVGTFTKGAHLTCLVATTDAGWYTNDCNIAARHAGGTFIRGEIR